MITEYFKNIRYSKSVTPGFYILEGGNSPYYVCAYSDRDQGKSEIAGALKYIPGYHYLAAGDFDFHHIIERQHLADISFLGQLAFDYENLPAAMIHKSEHKKYNSILHVKECRLLYLRDAITPAIKYGGWKMREREVVELLGNGVNSGVFQELKNRIRILREIYGAVYAENEIFKCISNNILDEYSRNLNLL